VVEELRLHPEKDPLERNKQEQALRSLIAEFQERCRGELRTFWLTAHLAPLQAAKISADVAEFRVPPSHRPKIGPCISLAKRAFIWALHPFHVEVLRGARNFNLCLVQLLEEVVAARDTLPSTALASNVRKTLAPLVDPGGQGMSPYIAVARRWLGQLLEQQRRWNIAALEALEAACSKDQPPRADVLVERLSREAELIGLDHRQGLGMTAPLWQEVFRRQIDFNNAATAVIAELLGVRPPPSLPQPTISYETWIAKREPIEISGASRAIRGLHHAPSFRVLVIGADRSGSDVCSCVASLEGQLYQRWDACVLKDPSASSGADARSQPNPRIETVALDAAEHLAQALGRETSTTQAEFIVFVSSLQLLAPHALAELALWIHSHPEVDVLYSDEDQLDSSGRRTQPFFKPDWSPDLLRSHNYFGNLLVVRRSLLQALGPFRDDLGGDPFFDLALRATERARNVGHVPRILHHRSRDAARSAKASVAALEGHLRRSGETAEIEPTSSGGFHVKYSVSGNPLVSIIVPFKDKPELLSKLVESLISITRYQNYELLLISNNSIKHETLRLLERLDDPRIRKLKWDHPFNYSSINNFGVAQARGAMLLFLNNDIEVCQAEWLEELLGHAQRQDIGAVGPKLLYPNGTIQHAGVLLGINGFAGHVFSGLPDSFPMTPFGHPDWVRNYLAVTAACLMTRKEIFLKVGGFDEHFEMVFGDIDLCLRIVRSGKRIAYTPHAKLVHHESASRKLSPVPYNDAWMSFLAFQPWLHAGDPFYNPNLSLLRVDGGLREHKLTAEELAMPALATQLEYPDGQFPAHPLRAVAEHLAI